MIPRALFLKKFLILLSFLLFFFLVNSLTLFAEIKKEFDLSVPYQQGVAASEAKDYDRAIESFRKVLFVDGSNARAQYKLAEALRAKGEFSKAFKEYQIFLKVVNDDPILSAEQKEAMTQKAEGFVEEIKKEKKGVHLLSFFDINVLIITFMLTIAFLIRLIKHFIGLWEKSHGEEKELRNVFVEAYWEKQQEKDITGIPFSFFTLIMAAVLIAFYFLSYRVLQNVF